MRNYQSISRGILSSVFVLGMFMCLAIVAHAQGANTEATKPQITAKIQVLDIRVDQANIRAISEHSPLWREAIVRVIQAGKGVTIGEQLRVRFNGSMDTMWVNSPKLMLGEYAEVRLSVEIENTLVRSTEPTSTVLLSVKETPPSQTTLAGLSDAIVIGTVAEMPASNGAAITADTTGYFIKITRCLKGNCTGTITLHCQKDLMKDWVTQEQTRLLLFCLVDGQRQFCPHLQQGFDDFTLPNRYAVRIGSEGEHFSKIQAAMPLSATLNTPAITVGENTTIGVKIANRGTCNIHCDGIVLEGYFTQAGYAPQVQFTVGPPQDQLEKLSSNIDAGTERALSRSFICQPNGWPKQVTSTAIAFRALVYCRTIPTKSEDDTTFQTEHYTVATPWQTVQVTLIPEQ